MEDNIQQPINNQETLSTYNKEAGVLLSENDKPLLYVTGDAGHVTFPSEAVWKIHKNRPGYVFKFVHTHPIGMNEASGLDKSMLTNWAKAFYPFPVRLSVMNVINDYNFMNGYKETIYYARWQDKEEWEVDKTKIREVELFIENELYLRHIDLKAWQRWLIDFSYKKLPS